MQHGAPPSGALPAGRLLAEAGLIERSRRRNIGVEGRIRRIEQLVDVSVVAQRRSFPVAVNIPKLAQSFDGSADGAPGYADERGNPLL
jgi:hypothetical protein